MTIEFYGGLLSNFSPHPIEVDGKQYPTVENWFQSQKAHGIDPDHEELVRTEQDAWQAKRLGRTGPLRPDWEAVNEAVMYRGLRAKFTQHPELAAELVATGWEEIVEHTPVEPPFADFYWGDGGTGAGRNRLGCLLMRLRGELQTVHYGNTPALKRAYRGRGLLG